jgi:energy-coupling factor transporter ATP-binding protein EcfA2
MDEWLSAGDASFLDKTQRRMESFVGSSSILVLASHSTELLRKWCNRGVLLQHGRIVADGNISAVIAAYTGAPPPAAGGRHGEISIQADIAAGVPPEPLRRLDTHSGGCNAFGSQLEGPPDESFFASATRRWESGTSSYASAT